MAKAREREELEKLQPKPALDIPKPTIKTVVENLIHSAERGQLRIPIRALRHVRQAIETQGPWLQMFEKVNLSIVQGQMIVLYGNRWTGKTVMAMALYCEALLRNQSAKYIRQVELLRTLRLWFNNKEEGDYESYAGRILGLLLIDESGVKVRGDGFSTTDAALLTTLIDERYSLELPTVFISNESLGEIKESLGPTIMRRIAECGQVIECNWSAFRRQA